MTGGKKGNGGGCDFGCKNFNRNRINQLKTNFADYNKAQIAASAQNTRLSVFTGTTELT